MYSPKLSQRGQYATSDDGLIPVDRKILETNKEGAIIHIHNFLIPIEEFVKTYKVTTAGKEVADFLDEKLLFPLQELLKQLPESDKQEHLKASTALGNTMASWRTGGKQKTKKRRHTLKKTRCGFHNWFILTSINGGL